MTFPVTVNATYEGGSLKLERSLELPDGTKLQITIAPAPDTAVLDERDKQIVREILEEDRDVFKALAR